MNHRQIGATLLKGNGLEIGALHAPFAPDNSNIEYVDIATRNNLGEAFFELDSNSIVEPNYIGDISITPVTEITGKKFEFIIANHILEHVPNPIKAIENMLDGLNKEGVLVLSVPDKNYSYDKKRSLTTFHHLLADYYIDANLGCESHYIDFVENVHPEAYKSKELFLQYFNSAKLRKEHLHVWTSETFKHHLEQIFDLLGYKPKILFESVSSENGNEYFVVIMPKKKSSFSFF